MIPTFHGRTRREHEAEGAVAEPIEWSGVFPGDVVIAPGSWWYTLSEFVDRNQNTRGIRVAFNPLFVIARSPYVHPDQVVIDAMNLRGFSTFTVYSITQGILIGIFST